MKKVLPDSQQTLVQWVSQATGINTLGVKVRLQGNDLLILCEATECPLRWRTLSDLLRALQQTDLDVLTSKEQPSIYQVLVYGRKKGENRPQWCHRVYLNQLDKHLEQVEQALKDSEASKPGGALIISNESLARRGDVQAIARYLSETLSSLGVSVQVTIKPDQYQVSSNRLWILCQSAYSPDPSLLAEPIAQKLRLLKLPGYQDAIIASQVNGETSYDWLLRIDLTPPELMLKEWARWGDVQAIARLLTEVLSEFKVIVQASLKESTLHLFCSPAANALEDAPDKTQCLETIVSQLEAIAPQGILGATVYGQKTGQKQPTWIDWISLPAAQHPALATSALELATDGDEPATHFLLERLLNNDLEWRLKTGGIRVILLRKGDLLHIMCDAPVCPLRKQVANKVTQFMRQLKLPEVAGIRVYGRRAGNKEPVWHHGVDFVQRQRLVPEATPEFAATSEYVGELLVTDTQEPIFRVELTSQEVQTFVTEAARDWVLAASTTFKNMLLGTQIFTDIDQSNAAEPDLQGGLKVALVWATLGLLLTLQTDWVLGQIVARTMPSKAEVVSVTPKPSEPKPVTTEVKQSQKEFLSNSPQPKSSQQNSSFFNASGFIDDDSAPKTLIAAPLKEKATASAILLAARSQMPSFNARQLDEQLALYRQRLNIQGHPPDVLVIGSSRALRGVDPAELSKALAKQGYADIDVFNFGVNGATAQVVDFIIRQVLEPSELPKLILWADGSRAFNSGREDITFNAIAASPGYKKIMEKAQATASADESVNNLAAVQQKQKAEKKPDDISTYQNINNGLNRVLALFSSSYKNRDQLKTLLHQQLDGLPLVSDRSAKNGKPAESATENLEEDTSSQAVDFDGFLPLSVRFNPARYYQKHPRVTGSYDNDYKSFSIEGKQDAAFQEVLRFTQSQQIPLVFINTPLTAEYLDPVRKKSEQEFQQYMLRLSANPNFIYRDFSLLWPRTNDYFSDPSHLNRFGAYEVSKKLAGDPMISWPTK
ncbi:DUF1574 family protein [Nostoc sp. FACHB-152]|uniref:DUF1574 family protein n=1 Tax=unclassified Nostoc TaxID=2593658 RepID=UPI001682B5A0|nr:MULTISPECIES: DUF1574 family protein [unclassified Nostoc]MBD2452225.1 DUF1574 family protein [Nostoc sp. FACHB-152]MBD2470996.1 DUF1574 family protein [Nostoc sp. FACHB-145]